MPKIEINEFDQTSPNAEQLSDDIVFVPGFAAVNENVYINTATTGDGATTAPTNTVVGTVFNAGDTVDANKTKAPAPSIYSNTTLLKSWIYTEVTSGSQKTYTWSESNTYYAPHPENEPILCNSVDEFKRNFGEAPAKFKSAQNIKTNCVADWFENSTAFRGVGDVDLSYAMAMQYLTVGIPVVYVNITKRITTDGNTKGEPYTDKRIADLYEKLPAILENISDPDYIGVKYITSGAYPTFEMLDKSNGNRLDLKMMVCASTRKDAYALIDHGDKTNLVLSGNGSVYNALATDIAGVLKEAGVSYGTMIPFWGTYALNTPVEYGGGSRSLPNSFGYVCALARSIAGGNPAYLAVAGVNRGSVPFLVAQNTTNRMSTKIANTELQGDRKVSVNPIVEIKPYGLLLYGNNTLTPNTNGKKATAYLNIRNLVCDVTRMVRRAAQRILFEPNTDAVWVTFKGMIMPSLDAMISGQGISRYNIVRVDSSDKTEVKAKIYLFPVYAVEKVTIDVILSDEGITVEGSEN